MSKRKRVILKCSTVLATKIKLLAIYIPYIQNIKVHVQDENIKNKQKKKKNHLNCESKNIGDQSKTIRTLSITYANISNHEQTIRTIHHTTHRIPPV